MALADPRLPGGRVCDKLREDLVALPARVHSVVGRDVGTPPVRSTECLKDLNERHAHRLAKLAKTAGEGAQAQSLLGLPKVGGTDHEGTPGRRLFENRPGVVEGFLEAYPRPTGLRRGVVGAKGEDDATVDLGGKPSQDFVAPAPTDVCAGVPAHAEVVVGDTTPCACRTRTQPPGPAQAFGIAGALH